MPVICWFATYAAVLRVFLPRMRERSRRMSREALQGSPARVVDSYTNILTVKLFARARKGTRSYARSIDEHTHAYRRQLRGPRAWSISLILMNAALLTGTGAIAIWLWAAGTGAGRRQSRWRSRWPTADRQYRRLGWRSRSR